MRELVKIVIAAIVVAGSSADDAQAQFPLTFVAGPSLMNISSSSYETSATVGFFGAVGTSFQLNESVSVSPFIGYVQKGAEFSDGTDGSYDYIEVPILFGVSMPLGDSDREIRFNAGPQLGLQINCDEDGFDCTEYGNHEGTEFGLVGNVGVAFPRGDNGSFSVGLGADLGMTDLFDGLDYKTRSFYLFVALSTMLGG